MNTKTQIDPARLRELEKAERKLSALEAGGVDNWDGYDFAMEEIRKQEEAEEALNELVDALIEAVSEFIEEPAGRGAGYGIRLGGEEAMLRVLRSSGVVLPPKKEAA